MKFNESIINRYGLRDDKGKIIGGIDSRSAADILSDEQSPTNILERFGISSRVGRAILRFVEQFFSLQNLTEQRVVIAIIKGKSSNTDIAEALGLSRSTVWRIRRKLGADSFWSKLFDRHNSKKLV